MQLHLTKISYFSSSLHHSKKTTQEQLKTKEQLWRARNKIIFECSSITSCECTI